MEAKEFFYQKISSPLGDLIAIAGVSKESCEARLYELKFKDSWHAEDSDRQPLTEKNIPLLRIVKSQLEEYFLGKRKKFDIPLSPSGTRFQTLAWNALSGIPFGQTSNYQNQASSIGRPKAVRAIGTANGANPICIILPCHRIIAKNGTLSGYAGGLSRKKFLLQHEGINMPTGAR